MEARYSRDALAGLRRPLYRGAEAELYLVKWFNDVALAKVRIAKPYRHQRLDQVLRRRRTVTEARAVRAALRLGVPAPAIYYVDPIDAVIVMEYVQGGRKLADVIDDEGENAAALVEEVGFFAARLHRGKVAHGDLTTSNILVKDRALYFIDFGLADLNADPRTRAVDLHLFLRSLESTHPQFVDAMYEAFLRGYERAAGREETQRLVDLVKEIRLMGRYREERRTAWSREERYVE